MSILIIEPLTNRRKETEKTMSQSHLALFQPIYTHKLNSWIYIFNHRPTCHFTWELT